MSVVLSGSRSNIRVSDATRRRVLAAAAELDYAPHPAAQALRRRRSGIIGYLPRPRRGLPFEHPIHYLLTIHATHAAVARGYQLLDVGAETDALRDRDELLAFLINRRVDGVLLDNPRTAGEVRRILDHGLPVVQMLRPQPVAAPAVTVDAAPGIAAAIAHLVGLGHRAIAFLGKGGPQPADRARLDAFAAATARHGLAPPDDHIRLRAGDYCLEHGQALARELLALPRRPTAIFAASDSLALGAAHALYEAQVPVPAAMSLVSYDDTLAPQLYPPLTGVAQPFAAVAERAIALLADRIELPDGAAGEPEQVVLPTRLNVRRSTAPPGDAGRGA